jgi:hypothetical protein
MTGTQLLASISAAIATSAAQHVDDDRDAARPAGGQGAARTPFHLD